VQCQESSFATCKSELANDCTTQCQASAGAIFCNGSYVNTSNIEECITALNAVLDVKIEAAASGSCTGNDCTGTASVKTSGVSCAASPARPTNAPFWAFGAAIVAAIAGTRRRARRG
jgi:MYXO-CTERM domain-containing protein